MHSNQTPFRPGGGGGSGSGSGSGSGGAQPSQQQEIHLNPNFFGNPNAYVQLNPGFFHHSNSFLHSTNNFPQFQQQFPNSNVPLQLIPGNSNFQTPGYIGNGNSQFPQQQVKVVNDMVEKLDKAARSARRDLLALNEHVSAWKVSQAALLTVKADSWESLGFQMQRVPSLNRLLVTEGKINAFIHCFVAVRRMTSLYDLEVAICESEGIARFEELELGPLVRHPLAVHYFRVTPDVTEVHRITTEEIISYLCEFIHSHKKKEVKVDTFLDFISQKRSVCGREKLFVRIQNIRGYIKHIEQERQSEDRILEKCYEKMRKKSVTRTKKRPLFAAQKKELDDNFTTISQRVKSFSSASTEFCGTHIRFMSSSSEDDESEDSEYADNKDENNTDSHCSSSLPNLRSDRVSSCPYPSATEEITRLGLKIEVDSSACVPSGSGRGDTDNELSQRKRRFQNMSPRTSLPYKLAKKIKRKAGEAAHSLSTESLRMFVTTWKETCRGNNADEVLERMLQFYNIRKKRKVKEFFTSYPFVGLLYAAVTCIKHEMWDNMYDTFQNLSETGMANKPCESSDDYLSIDVEPAQKDVAILESEILKHKYDVTAEEIMNKIHRYFEDDILNYKCLSIENKIQFLRKFCMCESWLIEQYSVDQFELLGYGGYVMFLEKYMHLLPHPMRRWMMGDILENDSLGDCLLPIQLDVFLSQALNNLCENETIETQNISELLAWQFPLVCLKLVNTNVMAKLPDIVREKRCNVTSDCILFSAPLLRLSCIRDSLTEKDKQKNKSTGMAYNTVARKGMTAAITSKDAIEVLLKAPMLTDLNLWSHWDFLYAPSLGSFVEWLLREVNTKEFLCLVTKDGKVIRIDHSATLDSFVDVLMRESSFEIAVQLLSLFVLYGGERNFPVSLLKCRARQAFEVIISNYSEVGLHDDKNPVMHGKPSCDQLIVGKNTSTDFGSKLPNKRCILNKAAPVMSRLILNSLSYLPIEFCSFAADILISGLQPFVKDVPSAILTECKQVDQRIMLHEAGMSLGIVEWVHDYNSVLSSVTARSSVGASCLDVVNSEVNTRSMIGKDELEKPSCYPVEVLVSFEVGHHDHTVKRVGGGAHSAKVPVEGQDANTKGLSRLDNPSDYDSARVIESIRQEEFGLDQCHSATENKMLEKQHARLGRALHCLSQELYSQDSHFLLELVQNADDNMYHNNVEPTLVFILQEKSIVVLNNEQGFLANNIRALCDVGNSTKCHGAGYIGKKGIGFKSVFRVTDAPEIHSNGFHMKFDITEGQIGFVLPTVVPPCDIDLYTSLASADADCIDHDFWNTCIVLPFRSDFLQGSAMNNILSMFQDLHPSLLLFLHRLQCIKFRNILDDSLIVMRKKVMGDGIVEVWVGHEKMTWFVVSRKLKADAIRSDVQTTEISIAFTLQEIPGGGYIPILDQHPVFAFLPLRKYGLKLILQGDFVLPSSREEVDGNSPWNQWLLLEFPDLFVAAERVFCNLSCYRGCPGKSVTVFMSFIPLVGEVHGFFSNLPRMIISKLRLSNCLILEGDGKKWVPPCKVLRNWTDQARSLLPDALLHEHLGLGFLDKDIVLSDSLAKALGVEDYGPKVLLRVISSLCCSENGLRSMGLSWLTSLLSAMYLMSSQTFPSCETESDCILNIRKIPFIPLSDGKYGSLDEDTIWLHCEAVGQGINDECLLKTFPKLYANLRIVAPDLLAAAAAIECSSSETTIVENVTRMLYKVGVQRLSAHDIMKTHILPAICDNKNAAGQAEMMIEYLAFAMFHLQSSCTTCSTERGSIVAELREKALILTNYGYKRSTEVPIHFNREYGNSVDVNKLISGLDMKWHEIDTAYLKHPITKSICGGQLKWRIFLQEMGVTDFVQVVQVEKSVPGIPVTNCKDIVSTNCVTKNWESEELFRLISLVSACGDAEKSKQVLEILDRLWDDYFSDKVTGYCIDSAGECKPFKSSLLSILQDLPWMASNINNELHYPKYLFHDCLTVNSVLGVSAPYANPKVRSEKLPADIGLKSQVTLDDALSVLNLWRRSESPFNASLSQMDSFYTFLWKEMTLSKKKIMEKLNLGPYIFVPNTSSFSHQDAVAGTLLSPQEVYWHNNIGPVDQIKSIHPKCVTSIGSSSNQKMIYNLYPSLHDFFVNECGVDESPSFCSYLQILLQLSTGALPHQAAKKVFEVFLMWGDALRSGSLSSEDVDCLKKSLLEEEYTVLPTKQDRWVSLHASFGLICWCDDDKLGSEFRYLEGVDFVNFGESTDDENQICQAKVSTIMQRLGITALSEIVTREAIYYGPADCSFIFSLVNWVLPYAQRYIYNANPDKYYDLKQSDFGNLRHLKIVVVENLFYRNIIKGCEITSKKRHECDCLLQDNILYCSRESDTHSIFLELSRLLYNGSTDLQFANFLHMIVTMAKSGASEQQTELFILNSQKMPKLPAEESRWFLEPASSSMENNDFIAVNSPPLKAEEHNSSVSKWKSPINPNWPPADWKTAPGFNSVSAFASRKPGSSSLRIIQEDFAEKSLEEANTSQTGITEFDIEVDATTISQGAVLHEAVTLESQSNNLPNLVASSMNTTVDSVALDIRYLFPTNSSERDEAAQQALLTGRMGELVAFKYFTGKVGDVFVKWVNETYETGLPYDIVLGGDENSREYVEVKATKSARKNWFLISMREWQFAIEKGESFSIAHVDLAQDNMARVTIYKNPARLCQLGNLKLAMMVPK